MRWELVRSRHSQKMMAQRHHPILRHARRRTYVIVILVMPCRFCLARTEPSVSLCVASHHQTSADDTDSTSSMRIHPSIRLLTEMVIASMHACVCNLRRNQASKQASTDGIRCRGARCADSARPGCLPRHRVRRRLDKDPMGGGAHPFAKSIHTILVVPL